MTLNDKIELTGKGFKWLRETLVLYGRAKVQGDDKLLDHIETEVDMIESVVKQVINRD